MRKVLLSFVVLCVMGIGFFWMISSQKKSTPSVQNQVSGKRVMTKLAPSEENKAVENADLMTGMTSYQAVVIETETGNVVIKLFPDAAPNAVKEFLTRVQEGYYDGTTFYDMQAGLGIAGGRREPYPRQDFTDENNSLPSKPGSVGIAKSALSNTYLNNIFIGFSNQPKLEPFYTIIGEVTEGLDLLEKAQPGLVMKSVKLSSEEKKS